MAETKKIVRFLATDIDGTLKLRRALNKIKGINFMITNALTSLTSLDGERKIGDLNENELKTLEQEIKSPKFPKWLLNRRKDIKTNSDVHLVGSQLDLEIREDINLMKKTRAYKGIRHEIGQPVRGQRTRSTFRTNKTIGVSKKAVQQSKSPTKKQNK